MPPRNDTIRKNKDYDMDLTIPQVMVDTLAEQVTHAKFYVIFQVLAEDMTSIYNTEDIILVYPNVGIAMVSVRNFSRMNLLEFYCLNVSNILKTSLLRFID